MTLTSSEIILVNAFRQSSHRDREWILAITKESAKEQTKQQREAAPRFQVIEGGRAV